MCFLGSGLKHFSDRGLHNSIPRGRTFQDESSFLKPCKGRHGTSNRRRCFKAVNKCTERARCVFDGEVLKRRQTHFQRAALPNRHRRKSRSATRRCLMMRRSLCIGAERCTQERQIYLVTVDSYSRYYIEIIHKTTTTSKNVISKMKDANAIWNTRRNWSLIRGFNLFTRT